MKEMKSISKYFLILAFVVVVTDQISKFFVRNHNISHVLNTGAGFGTLQNQTFLLVMISVIILVLGIRYYHIIPKKISYQTFSALVAGGLIGNLIDRLIFGGVIDFIDLKIWPSFNIADICLSAGFIGMIVWLLKEK